MKGQNALIPPSQIESLILSIRGRRVILDSDLARLYGVTTTRLNEQVKWNRSRFPADFVFSLSQQEVTALISQNATSKGRGGRRKLPNVFTKHTAIMAPQEPVRRRIGFGVEERRPAYRRPRKRIVEV